MRAVITAGTTQLLATDYYVPCDPSGGPIILEPPAPPFDGQVLFIKDVTGAASGTNYIEFAGTVDVLVTPKITIATGWLRIRYDAAQAKWMQGG